MKQKTFRERRKKINQLAQSQQKPVLIPAAPQVIRNIPTNIYWPFRQSSHFLYYTGLKEPNSALLILPDGEEILLLPKPHPDSIIWEGEKPTPESLAKSAEITNYQPIEQAQQLLKKFPTPPLFPKPFNREQTLFLSQLLQLPPEQIAAEASEELALAIIEQRISKTKDEINEIEQALSLTGKIFKTLIKTATPGIKATELLGKAAQIVLSKGWDFSFAPIITQNPEILHATTTPQTLQPNKFLLVDLGVETPSGYCSDITRTWPIGSPFTPEQKAIYETVLKAQNDALSALKPDINFREVHLIAARSIAESLKELGLLKGPTDSIVETGAHALFFPHGLGHLLGLDVHDLEDLGDLAGYPPGEKRSQQFGLNFLRLAKPLKPGFVITIEPGVYFIPSLIERWAKEQKLKEFINYHKIEVYSSCRGVRIEDDVLITESGARVLGPKIPKTTEELGELIEKK